jgi:alpha-beta hydrolase superfamily lysophospholipase
MLINKNDVYFRKWVCKNSRAIILAIHGMGAHSERYMDMAKFLNSKKISTYSIALRGYGELFEKKCYRIKDFCNDIKKLKEIIIKENPGKPIFILGESMGALIAHVNVMQYDNNFSGIIEIAPVYKDIMKINLLNRIKIAFLSILFPNSLIKMPFKTEELTRDKKMIFKLTKDKRETRVASAGLLLDILLNQIKVALFIKKIKLPVLFLLAQKDMLGDTNYNIKLFNKLNCDKELKAYKDSYHALTIEKNRKVVFKDIYNWIKKYF